MSSRAVKYNKEQRGRRGNVALLELCLVVSLLLTFSFPYLSHAQSVDDPLPPPLSRAEEDERFSQALDTLSKITKKTVRRVAIWQAIADGSIRVAPDQILALEIPASLEAREVSSGLSVRDYATFHALLTSGFHSSGEMVMIPKVPGLVPHLESENGGEYAITKEGALFMIPKDRDPFSAPERVLTLPLSLVARIPSKPQERSGDMIGFFKFIDWYGLVLSRDPAPGEGYKRAPEQTYEFTFGPAKTPLGSLSISLESPIPPTPTPISISVKPTGSLALQHGQTPPFVPLEISPIEERVKVQLFSSAECTQAVSDSVGSDVIKPVGIQAQRLPKNEERRIFARGFDDFGSASECVHVATYIIDTVAPLVERITTATSTSTLTKGSTISLTVNFSEVVQVDTGATTPVTIALNSGGRARYVGGSGTQRLEFTYTVGDESSDVGSLQMAPSGLSSGVMDLAGNKASTISPSGSGVILASGKPVRVAITAPLSPVNVSALSKGGAGSVVFVWQPIAGKPIRPSSWVVESSTIAKGPFAPLTSGEVSDSTSLSAAFMVDLPNLKDGIDYYLRIRFDNGPIKGRYTPGVLSVKPRARPGAPRDFKASFESDQVRLSVNRAIDPTVGATTYVFEKRRRDESRWNGVTVRDSGTVFIDTAKSWTQPPSTEFVYRVKAVNANQEASDWSAEASVTIPKSVAAQGSLTIDCLGYQVLTISVPNPQRVQKLVILDASSVNRPVGEVLPKGSSTVTFKPSQGVREGETRGYRVKTITTDKRELESEVTWAKAPACPIPEPKALSVVPADSKSPPGISVSFTPDPSCSYEVAAFEGGNQLKPRSHYTSISRWSSVFPGRIGSAYTVVVKVSRRGRTQEFQRQITLAR